MNEDKENYDYDIGSVKSLTIEPKEKKDNGNKKQQQAEGKGRSFQAELLAYVQADSLWMGDTNNNNNSSGNIRPLWLMLGGGAQEMLSFVANIRQGYKMVQHSGSAYSYVENRFEIMKKKELYQYDWQRIENGPNKYATVRIYQPEYVQLGTGGLVDLAYCKFLMLVPKIWSDSANTQLTNEQKQAVIAHCNLLAKKTSSSSISSNYTQYEISNPDEIIAAIPKAVYFCSMLDRRTEKPLVNDIAFYVQLYLRALQYGIANLPFKANNYHYNKDKDPWNFCRRDRDFKAEGTALVGLLEPVMCNVAQQTLNQFLAKEVKLYFEIKGYHSEKGKQARNLTLTDILEVSEKEKELVEVAA